MRAAHASSSALRALTASPSCAAAGPSSTTLLARRAYTPSPPLCNSRPGRVPPPHMALPSSYLLEGGNDARRNQRQPPADGELLLAPPEALKPLRSLDDQSARNRSSRPKAQLVARNLINEATLTAEGLALISKTAAGGGPLKNGLIPRTLLVCPVIPPEGKPGPPTLAGDLASRPDVRALVEAETHDLVLVKIGKTLSARSSSGDVSPAELSIVRLVERPTATTADASSTAAKLKAKETRAQSALGKTSNLRNDGVPQEVVVSWVTSSNDLSHKLAQARELLSSAHRVKLTFQPKRKGGRRDPVPPPDVQREMLDAAAEKLADIAERSGDDRFDKGKNAAYLFLEPTPKVRAAYRKLAEAKDATEASARAADQQRKEERKARAAEKLKEAERAKAANRAFLSSL